MSKKKTGQAIPSKERTVTRIYKQLGSPSVVEALPPPKKKVAAYCRVSTDSDEQLNSYYSQKTYYEDKIKSNPEWEFAGIYADVDTPYGLNPKSP